MELNPISFPYRPDKTTTKITYIWEQLYSINASLKIADQWLPQLRYQNDIAVMDKIIEAQQQAVGTAAFIPNQRLVYANACRLWLQATVLSDITDLSGSNILSRMLDGTGKCESNIQYPTQAKPPPIAWKKWRMAIRQSFLGRAHGRLFDPPLVIPLHTKAPTSNGFDWTPKPALRGAPLRYIFSQLPIQWQSILAPTSWPSNDGSSIAYSLRKNNIIHGYLDGSVAEGL